MRYGMVRLTPGVRNIMLLSGAMFILDGLVSLVSGRPLLAEWLGVVMEPRNDPARTWLQVWRPFTYTLIHQDFFHLLWNMVGLFFLGAALEESVGTARFYRVYVASGVLGALVAIGAAWFSPGAPYLVGASAAVLGTTFAFITLHPNETIMLWVLVLIPIRALYLGILFFLIQFVSAFSGGGSNVSYVAHLGGIASGVAMAHFGLWFDNLSPLGGLKRKWRRRHLRAVPQPRSQRASLLRERPPAGPKPTAVEVDLEREVDAILDKVRSKGMDALTAQERRALDMHSTRLRQRDRTW
jgi:membrane associated rhomboid family serine protease